LAPVFKVFGAAPIRLLFEMISPGVLTVLHFGATEEWIDGQCTGNLGEVLIR